MDYLTALVTIVQLLALFTQERDNQKQATDQEFFRWMEEHRHNELKDLIANSHHLTSEVQQLLREDHVAMLARIEDVNRIAAEILARIDSFSGLAQTLVPERIISEDAIELLRLFYRSGAPFLNKIPGKPLLVLGVSGQGIELSDTRFLKDDLSTLVELGLLQSDTARPEQLFHATRRGEQFVARLSQKV